MALNGLQIVSLIEKITSLVLNVVSVYILSRWSSSSMKEQGVPQQTAAKLSHVFLVTLFVSHTVSCLNGIPAEIFINQDKRKFDEQFRLVQDIFFVTHELIFICEVLTTIAISIDRYVAIRKPFYYQTLTRKNAYYVVMTIVFIATTHSISAFIFDTTYTAISFLVVLGCFAICVCNYRLFREVKRQCILTISNVVSEDLTKKRQIKRRIKLRQLRSLRMCLVIVVTFMVLWIPYLVVFILSRIRKELFSDHYFLLKMVEMLAILNGIVDVLTFFIMKRQARKMFVKIFLPCLHKSRVSSDSA